jgi:hypothetical protein
MKPLPRAPLTKEDIDADAFRQYRLPLDTFWWVVWRGHQMEQDRRDAELMLAARMWRADRGLTVGMAIAWSPPCDKGTFRLDATGPWGGRQL